MATDEEIKKPTKKTLDDMIGKMQEKKQEDGFLRSLMSKLKGM